MAIDEKVENSSFEALDFAERLDFTQNYFIIQREKAETILNDDKALTIVKEAYQNMISRRSKVNPEILNYMFYLSVRMRVMERDGIVPRGYFTRTK